MAPNSVFDDYQAAMSPKDCSLAGAIKPWQNASAHGFLFLKYARNTVLRGHYSGRGARR